MGGGSKKGRKDRKDRQNLADILTLNYSCVQQAAGPVAHNQYLVERSSTGEYVPGRASYRPAPPKRKHVDPKTLKEGFMAHHYQFVLRPYDDFHLSTTPIRPLPEPGKSFVRHSPMPPLDHLTSHRAQQMTTSFEVAAGAFDGVIGWDHVLFVVVSLPIDEYTCPICLEVPTTPRMTSCGHIFCFSCILRSMNAQKNLGTSYSGTHPTTSDPKAKKRTCPMCSATTGATELRPCIHHIISERHPQRGEEESFALVCRHKDCAVAVKGDAYERCGYDLDHWVVPCFGSEDALFSRYCFATEGLLEEHFEQELGDLQRRLHELEKLPRPYSDDDAYEHCAIEEAIQLLLTSGYNFAHHNEHKQALLRRLSPMSGDKFPPFEEGSLRMTPSHSSSLTAAVSDLSHISRPPAQAPVLWFYQSADGSRRYLHSLNRRMLRKEYRARTGLANAPDGAILPPLIQAPILAVMHPIQDPDTKASDVYTAHVPLGSTLTTVYVDLTGLVSPEVMTAFEGERRGLEHKLHLNETRAKAAEEEAAFYAAQASERSQARSSQFGYRGTFSQNYTDKAASPHAQGEELTAEELAWLAAEGGSTAGSSPSLKSRNGPVDLSQLPDLSSLEAGNCRRSSNLSSESAHKALDKMECGNSSSVGASTLDDNIKNHGSQRQAKRMEAIVAADRQRMSSDMPAEPPHPTPEVNPFAVLQSGSQWAQRAATADYNRLHGAAVPHAKPSWAGRPMKSKDH